jgi:hypothetical protein
MRLVIVARMIKTQNKKGKGDKLVSMTILTHETQMYQEFEAYLLLGNS